jgi:hypothetical protein
MVRARIQRLIYLLLFIVFIVVVALRASITPKRVVTKEGFIDNVFVAPLKPAVKFFEAGNITLQENASAKETWKKCNIFTCKNKDAQNDYDNWLELQREKLANNKQEREKLANYMKEGERIAQYMQEGDKIVNKQKKPKQCPPRITQEELNEPVMTEEETEVLDRLDDVEGQIAEAEQRLQDLNQEINDQEIELAMNIINMQEKIINIHNMKK